MTFSPDPVVNFLVTEAVSARASAEEAAAQKKADERQKINEWKNDPAWKNG